MKNRLGQYLAVTVMTIVLASGCSGTAPGSPKTDGPRYQVQVIGEQGNVYVYRLDTASGEIETFLVTSPQVIQRLSPEAAKMLSDIHGSLTFTPGPTVAGKRK